MKTITAQQLKQAIDANQSMTLLDVRQAEELAICKLENTVHIPMNTINEQKDTLNKDDSIVVLCHHGMRSAQVAMYLEQQGFTDISNLQGGIHAWANEVDATMRQY